MSALCFLSSETIADLFNLISHAPDIPGEEFQGGHRAGREYCGAPGFQVPPIPVAHVWMTREKKIADLPVYHVYLT